MKLPPLNYLVIEILTLLYPLFLFSKKQFPLIMIIIIIMHILRLEKYWKYVNKNLQENIQIFVLSIILWIGLLVSQNFILFGILFGVLQYITYRLHEKQHIEENIKYKWIENYIDLPILLASGIISFYGLYTENLLVAPFLGDFLYHILEFYTFMN